MEASIPIGMHDHRVDTRQDHTIHSFQEEHQRLMRALHNSLERESDLQRQVRRMKEELVAAALRLQVAIKMSEEDGLTLTSLRKQAEESRIQELVSRKQANEAASIIQTLRLEISSLKRRLKESSGQSTSSAHHQSHSSSAQVFEDADAEVDEMFRNVNKATFHPDTGGEPYKATGFQQWKIQKFLYSPDTPAGSLNHEKHAVDLLTEAATREMLASETLRKRTKSSIPKMRRSASDAPSYREHEGTFPHIDTGSRPDSRNRGEKGSVNIWTSANASITTSPKKQTPGRKAPAVPIFV